MLDEHLIRADEFLVSFVDLLQPRVLFLQKQVLLSAVRWQVHINTHAIITLDLVRFKKQ